MNQFFGFQGGSPKKDEPKQEKRTGWNDIFGSIKNIAEQVVGEVKTIVDDVQKDYLLKEEIQEDVYVSDEYLQNLYQGVRAGNADCALQLYNMYLNGNGVYQNIVDAYFWARMADWLGSIEGTYFAGCILKSGFGEGEDDVFITSAYPFFEKAARVGHAGAAQVVQEIERKYVEYYGNDMQFNAYAKNRRGLDFLEGEGVSQNYITARYWFKRAIEADYHYALYNLGKMYECGLGVFVDYEEAKRLYTLAASCGHEASKRRLACMETYMNMSAGALFTKACNLAHCRYNEMMQHQLRILSAQKGNADAVLSVAYDYRRQNGVKRNYFEALFWYGRAIMMGTQEVAGEAFYNLSTMFALGQAGRVNMDNADLFYERARECGYANALKYPNVQLCIEEHQKEASQSQWDEARMYRESFYCEVDMLKAMAFYEVLGWAGKTKALLELASQYGHAFATERDENKMLDYLKQARDRGWNNPQEEIHIVKGMLLSYYNLCNFARFEEFDREVAINIAEDIMRRKHYRLGYAYLAIARDLGADVEPIIRLYDRERAHCPDDWTSRPNENSDTNTEEILYYWDPDPVTDEQYDEIEQLVQENKIQELYELAIAYVDEEVEPERTTNARLAAMCLKHAIDHHHLGALLLYAELAAGGHWGFPQNVEVAKYIVDKVEEEFDLIYIAKAICSEEELEQAFKEEAERFISEENCEKNESNQKGEDQELDSVENASPFEKLRNQITEAEEYERNMSEENRRKEMDAYQEIAGKMADDYFEGEEWYIYEHYRLADYRRNGNDSSAISESLPFADAKLEIEGILAEMKAEYIKSDSRAEKAEGVHLAKEGEERPDELPENLDAYFEDMIGMDSVKFQLNKIYQTVKIQMMREKALRERGIESKENEKGYNFILLGNPGTGKTTVARIIAKILYDIQIRESDSFVEIERSSVVGSYIGETEKQIAKILKNVKGGTLFIDEAYTLYKEDSENDVGAIVIDTLMKDMEDNRNSYSVILAGYKEPMLNMIRHANSGFSSRFTYVIELPDYSDDALIKIAHMHMDKQKLIACEGVDEAIVKCIHYDKLDQTFGNARYIRELVNRAIENQSERLNAMESFETEDLFQLKPEDFWQGNMEEEDVEKYLKELNDLIGLESVKKEVEALIHTIEVQKEMEKRGMQVSDNLGTLHMAFKGNPGTGKTTVARIIGKLYASLGILKRGDVFVECTRSDLVGKYQGHTADKVRKVVESALGGVLFIDEAYALVQGEGDSFGLEAVSELVAEMENNRQNLVIILAGYTNDIDEFLKNNPGLRSRVPKDLFFEDYSMEELYEISLNMLKGKNLIITEEAKQELRARLMTEYLRPDFGNARGVRNIIEQIWRKQNVRIANLLKVSEADITNEMIVLVEKEDVIEMY